MEVHQIFQDQGLSNLEFLHRPELSLDPPRFFLVSLGVHQLGPPLQILHCDAVWKSITKVRVRLIVSVSFQI